VGRISRSIVEGISLDALRNLGLAVAMESKDVAVANIIGGPYFTIGVKAVQGIIAAKTLYDLRDIHNAKKDRKTNPDKYLQKTNYRDYLEK
jgi:hypothetical protein